MPTSFLPRSYRCCGIFGHPYRNAEEDRKRDRKGGGRKETEGKKKMEKEQRYFLNT